MENAYSLDDVISEYKLGYEYGKNKQYKQIAAWLEELADLRAILKERIDLEKWADERAKKGKEIPDYGPITLEEYIDLQNPMLWEEKEILSWAKQLFKARRRIGDN